MAVNGEEEGRPVRKDRVELGPVRPLRREHVDAPAEAADRAGRVILGILLYCRQHLGQIGELEIEARRHEGAQKGVGVPLDEAGHQQPPLKVDELRLRAGHRPGAGLITDMDDGIAAHRDRVRPWRGTAHGVDGTVIEHEIRRAVRDRRGLLGARIRCNEAGRQSRRSSHCRTCAQHRTPAHGPASTKGLEKGRPVTCSTHLHLPPTCMQRTHETIPPAAADRHLPRGTGTNPRGLCPSQADPLTAEPNKP